MSLQQEVGLRLAAAVPGDRASPDQSRYAPGIPLAAEPVRVGRFVFPTIRNGMADPLLASPGAAGVDAVLGFVERLLAYPDYDLLSQGSLSVPAGSPLAVAVRGDYWAVAASDAALGEEVLASTADGSLSTAPAGSAGDADHIATGWKVTRPGKAGELIIISK